MATQQEKHVSVYADADRLQRKKVVEHKPSTRHVIVNRLEQLIWLVVGVIGVLLLTRLLLKLMNANNANAFVEFVYGASEFFIAPFQQLVANPVLENGGTVDVGVFFAAFAYTFVAAILVLLLRIFLSDAGGVRRVTTYEQKL